MSDEATLRAIVRDFHWQARRYMDGRRTGAKQFNDHTRALLAMGVRLSPAGDGTLWARDADGRAYDGLSDAEAAQGRPLDEHTVRAWRDEDAAVYRALLAALVATEPIAYEQRGARCVMCDGEYDRLPRGRMGIQHADTCPWLAAKQALGVG